MRSGWNWSMLNLYQGKNSYAVVSLLLTLAAGSASAQKGVPMTPERLDSLTQGRTMTLRVRASTLTQVTPNVTQQMLYRTRLTPEAPDLSLSVFCSGAKLSQFDHAVTTLFGYRLIGRFQGEGMGLVFVPDPKAMARAGQQRVQGKAAVEAGVNLALAWLKQPAALGEIARTRCPAASALKDEKVRRAFALYAGLTRGQRDVVMAGHPVTVPYPALPASSRALLKEIKPAPRWLTFYLYLNPWASGGGVRMAVKAEPTGQSWISSPPLELVPAHFPATADTAPAFKTKLSGMPDLEDLEPGEEAPAILEWMSEQGKIWVMSETLGPYQGGAEQLKKFAASCSGLTLEEGLDRVAAFFGASWRYDDGWVLLKRRSTESLTVNPRPAPAAHQAG